MAAQWQQTQQQWGPTAPGTIILIFTLALFEIDLLFNQLIHLCLPFETSQVTDSNERDKIIFWGNMSHL